MVHEMFQNEIDIQPGDSFFLVRVGERNGLKNMHRMCSGFNTLELLGALSFIERDIANQFDGKSTPPEIVTKTYIKQEEVKP